MNNLSLEELREKARKEITAQKKMCRLIPWGPPDAGEHPGCPLLNAALVSAKTTLAKGSPRRVFVQDLAAALDRRDLIKKGKYDEFVTIGHEYMEA